MGERRLVAQAFGVVAGGHEECRGSVGPDAEAGDECGCGLFTKGFKMASISEISSSSVRARRASIRSVNLVSETTSRFAPGR